MIITPRVMLGFDMETDVGSWTPYYEGIVHGTPRVLDVLDKHAITTTFYFVASAAQQHPTIVKQVDQAGHDVGCHTLFHENIGDELFPIPGMTPILPHECGPRIKLATDIMSKIVGKKMRSFRASRLFGSTAMINTLEGLGYTSDASYPMYYYQKRLQPYHPSRKDWTRKGDLKIVEIPNFADMTIKTRDAYGRDRDQWPLIRTQGAEALIQHVDNMLKFYARKNVLPVICLYMHPWEFHPMPQGMIHFGEGSVKPDSFIVKNCGSKAVRELNKLIRLLKDRGAEFMTARDLAKLY